MRMWLIYLGFAVAIIGISYGLSVWSFNEFLYDQGIYQGDDGHYYCRWTEGEDPSPPDFTYCLKSGVLEAFQVGNDVMPAWAVKTPEIDVIVSEPRRVVIHQQDGAAIVKEGEWVIRFPDGTIGLMHTDDISKSLVKIKIEEECR